MARSTSPVRVPSNRVTVSPAKRVPAPTEFYRQEFLRHRQCLAQQREYFSERAISDADQALAKVIAHLEQLCAKDDAEQIIGRLLRTFNAVTGLSAWSDPQKLH
jgi:hypothetical protein